MIKITEVSQSNVSYVVALIKVDESPWCVWDEEDNDNAGQQSHHGSVTSATKLSSNFSFNISIKFSKKPKFCLKLKYFIFKINYNIKAKI